MNEEKKYVPVERTYPNGARMLMMYPKDKYNQTTQLQQTAGLASLDEAFAMMAKSK